MNQNTVLLEIRKQRKSTNAKEINSYKRHKYLSSRRVHYTFQGIIQTLLFILQGKADLEIITKLSEVIDFVFKWKTCLFRQLAKIEVMGTRFWWVNDAPMTFALKARLEI